MVKFRGLLRGLSYLEERLVLEVLTAFMYSEDAHTYKQPHCKEWLKTSDLDLVRVKLALRVLGFVAEVVDLGSCETYVTLEVSLNE